MATWNHVLHEAPEPAKLAQERIEATGLALLATIRRDGSPRISGIEPSFFDDDLWLGSMDGALKAKDLRRDPRFALHNATVDKEVKEGDVKISGRAVEILDEDEKLDFLRRFAEANGYGPPPGPFHLFRADVTEVATIRPGGDHLDIDIWVEGKGVRRVERS
jgi:hypothetical protein